MNLVKLLFGTPLFENISIEELQRIMSNIRQQSKKYQDQEVIIFQNSMCEFLHFLYQGQAMAGRISQSGKYFLVEELKAPKVIAPAFIFGDENRFPVTVTAINTCQVLTIPKKDFLLLLQQNQQILQNFIRIISQQVIYLSKKVKLTNMTLKEKIATYVLSNCKDGENSFLSGYTQQKLADLFGVARTSLARSFALMEEEGIISLRNRTITILNKNLLRELTE